jgi:hypothetical protein
MKRSIFILGLLVFLQTYAVCQDWKKIKPMISTCADVMKIFKTDKCNHPTTRLEFDDYRITIDFTTSERCEKNDLDAQFWNAPKGMVIYFLVSLKKGIELRDYAADISKYKKEPVSDVVGAYLYLNEKAGIRITTMDGKIIQNVFFYPPAGKKYRCSKLPNRKTSEKLKSVP